MIRNVFLFQNGNMACTDENGQQVPAEQEAPWLSSLREKYRRGVVDLMTMVHLPWGDNMVLGDLNYWTPEDAPSTEEKWAKAKAAADKQGL